ncbi:MAG: DMT family transporter [Gemmatimonadales bacterium]
MSPRLRVVAAAVLFSTGGTAIKWCGFGTWQLAAGRACIAMWTIALLIPEARRRWTWWSLGVGIGYAVAGTCFIFANKLTTAASAIFIQATNPLFILAFAPLLLHERVTRRDVKYMAVLAVGMGLLLSEPGRRYATAPHPALGNLFAVGCAVSWALTVIGFRWVARTGGWGAVAAAAVSGNALVFLVALPLALPLDAGRARDWLALAFLGVFQLGLAYVFLSRAIPEVRALDVSLILLVEPVLSSVWAWLVHGEALSARAVVGGMVILVGTAVHAWREPPAVSLPAPALEG